MLDPVSRGGEPTALAVEFAARMAVPIAPSAEGDCCSRLPSKESEDGWPEDRDIDDDDRWTMLVEGGLAGPSGVTIAGEDPVADDTEVGRVVELAS